MKASAVAASIKVIDNPAYLIAVVPDLPEGRLSGHDRDLLGAARGLAEAEGGAVMVVVFADPGEDLAGAGADRVLSFAGAIFEGYAPEPRTQAVAAAVAAYQPRHLLFPDSPLGGADLGRRVAARLGERPATGAWQIALDQTTRRACGGSEELILPTPQVLLVTEEAADPVDDSRREARQVDSPPVALKARIEDLGPIAVDPENVSLAEAELILAAGNGIRDWDCFHRLAQALGAAEGGSRVVVDAGFLPRQRQVGATGTLVTARCYVAFGISGASQHLQGISRCEQVVAVNVDPSCNMVKRADLAVIGDVQAIMPELLRLVQGEKP